MAWTPRRICSRFFKKNDVRAYSAFDFVIRPDDTWVTLEANGSGMWGWLAEECGLPIAEAIADELTAE